jgi:hypothetical protein
MALSESTIRRIIREEARRVLREGDDDDYYRATPEDISAGVEQIIRYYRSEDEKRRLLDSLDNVESNIEGASGWLHVSEMEDFDAREDAGMIARDVVGNEFVISVDDLRAAIAELRSAIKDEVGMTPVEQVIEQFKDEGRGSWNRVSNDFHEMADGGDGYGVRDQYYPGWRDEDFRKVAKTLDAHFGM